MLLLKSMVWFWNTSSHCDFDYDLYCSILFNTYQRSFVVLRIIESSHPFLHSMRKPCVVDVFTVHYLRPSSLHSKFCMLLSCCSLVACCYLGQWSLFNETLEAFLLALSLYYVCCTVHFICYILMIRFHLYFFIVEHVAFQFWYWLWIRYVDLSYISLCKQMIPETVDLCLPLQV